MTLSYEIIGPEDSQTPRVFFVHGILGSGRNFSGFARRLLRAHPNLGALLVDLRAHGSSHGFAAPHGVDACANDLAELCAHLGYEPFALSGHSFGGKVVARYAELYAAELKHLFVLDAPLKESSHNISGLVEQVIEVLREIDLNVARREDVKNAIISKGLSASLASWMTTNLKNADAGFSWRFDLEIVETLLQDYRKLNAFTLIESPPSGVDVHIIHGQKSDRVFDTERPEIIEKTKSNDALTFDILPDAAHWVHADNPKGLCDIFSRYLGEGK